MYLLNIDYALSVSETLREEAARQRVAGKVAPRRERRRTQARPHRLRGVAAPTGT